MADPTFEFPRMGELLHELGIRPSKNRDQHFLRNPGVTRRIAELCGLTDRHVALEVGAGLGNLSVELARRAGDVVSVEMDRSFTAWHRRLQKAFPGLSIELCDFMKYDVQAFAARFPGRPLVAAGNLPYQITSPAIFHLMDSGVDWERIVVMMQLEVAERIAAGVPNRKASALTYKLAILYDARIALRVAAVDFIPPPKVQSAVLVLEPKPKDAVPTPERRQRMFEVISGVFQYRRRSIANGLLLSGLAPSRSAAFEALDRCRIQHVRRPETLGLDEVEGLAVALDAVRG